MAIDPALLERFKLYRGLPAATLSVLAAIAIPKKLRKGQRLWRQGDTAEGYYSSITGLVKSFRETGDGREQVLCLLGPGMQIGTMSVLSGAPMPCHATVLEGGDFLFFPKGPFTDAVRQDHHLALHLLGNLANQCNVLANRIEDLALRDAEERVGHYLLSLPVKSVDEDGLPLVRLPVSKTTLAAMLGLSRETLSRTFSLLQQRGWITNSGRAIALKDIAALEALEDRHSSTVFTH